MAIFFATSENIECGSNETEYSIEIKGFKPISALRFTLDRFGIGMKNIPLEEIPDRDFSGEITYSAVFELPESPTPTDKYRIVLEDTSVTAAVSINGEKVADFGMTPMLAIVDGKKIAKSGEITVTVANTAADEILAKKDVINSYPKAEVGPYSENTYLFEERRPTLNFGRVKIEKIKE